MLNRLDVALCFFRSELELTEALIKSIDEAGHTKYFIGLDNTKVKLQDLQQQKNLADTLPHEYQRCSFIEALRISLIEALRISLFFLRKKIVQSIHMHTSGEPQKLNQLKRRADFTARAIEGYLFDLKTPLNQQANKKQAIEDTEVIHTILLNLSQNSKLPSVPFLDVKKTSGSSIDALECLYKKDLKKLNDYLICSLDLTYNPSFLYKCLNKKYVCEDTVSSQFYKQLHQYTYPSHSSEALNQIFNFIKNNIDFFIRVFSDDQTNKEAQIKFHTDLSQTLSTSGQYESFKHALNRLNQSDSSGNFKTLLINGKNPYPFFTSQNDFRDIENEFKDIERENRQKQLPLEIFIKRPSSYEFGEFILDTIKQLSQLSDNEYQTEATKSHTMPKR